MRLAVGAMLLVAVSALAAEARFRGAADLRLGEKIHAAFPDLAPVSIRGPHRYTFFASAGTPVSATVRADKGSGLAPELRLTRPGGVRLDVGASAHGLRIERFRVPYAGLFVLEVTPRKGSGGYTLTTGGRVARSLHGLFPAAPSGDLEYAFEAAEDTRLSVRVAPHGRGPRIEITGVTRPDGEDIAVLSLQHQAAAEVRNVPLPLSGRYVLRFTNHGEPGDLRLAFRFAVTRPPSDPRELGASEGRDASVIESTDATAARAGYVGSRACGRCHDELVRSWSMTAHNNAVRSWDRAGLAGAAMVNDANANGIDDFKDGLDLATTPAFAAYGANAPKLSYVSGTAEPYQVTIGGATHGVVRVMGGNGLFAQRYLTSASGEHQPLPFQFDETTRTYSAYEPQDWYLEDHSVVAARASERSYEARCSGCHETGETIALNASGRLVTSSVETNIGCEQCHGPGAEHAANGDVRKIKNPRGLLDGTAGGAAKANDVCARCHTKGTSVGQLPGNHFAGFGFAGGNVAQAYDDPAQFLVPTRDPADFWGLTIAPLPTLPGDLSLAARGDRAQAPDVAVGAHAATSGNAAACFDCHDPHRRANRHQVATSVDRGLRVATRTEDNTLCLACHAGAEPFAATSLADAAAIRGGAAPAATARAVQDHMKDVGMPVRDGSYDPQGTGVGRCTTCHMPATSSTGAPSTDAAGFVEGDLHSHRFRIIWPNASAALGVTNSCNTCHPTGGDDKAAAILTQWASPAPGRTAFHGATPPALQDGHVLNETTNPEYAGGVRCIACHTSEGFVRLQVKGESLPQPEVDRIAKAAIGQDKGITCDACHGRRADGQFYGADANPLRLPKEEICATCHNDETVSFADFRDHGAIVRHPQREMLAGTAGDAPAGASAVATTAHSFLVEGCVACHYDAEHGVGRHDFRPNVATCAACHTNLTTFDRPAKADYDGDGVVRGIQTEVTGLLDRVKTALLVDPRVTSANGYFDFDGATDHKLTGASEAQARAVFNWSSVAGDGSRGVHDAARAVQLLQKSYRELTGIDVPGATLR